MKTLSSLSLAFVSMSVLSFGSLLGGCAAATEDELANLESGGSTSDAIKGDGFSSNGEAAGGEATISGKGTAGPGKCACTAIGRPPQTCANGGTPSPDVCEVQKNGSCGWTYGTCPVNKECQPTDCGPVPLKPTLQCEDGSTPPPPVCVGTVGKCSWSYGTCPATGIVLSGDWGGKDISLTATPVKGQNVSNIRIELFCASVLFSIGPIGKDGTFKSTAGYFASGSNNAEKVIVSGGLSTSGTQLKIEITDLNGKLIGAYLLDKGKVYPFYKCD